MRRLVFTGKRFEFTPDERPLRVQQPGDMPKLPQKVRLIKPYVMLIINAVKDAGNGFKPGPMLDLAPDQCRYTVEGKTMCGAKIADKSWCAHHLAVVYPARRRFMEAAE